MAPRMPTGAGHTLLFQIDPLEGTAERRIRLFVDGAPQAVAEDRVKLSFEGPTKAALAAIQAGKASEVQVKTGGLALWERLRTGAIGQALEPLRTRDAGALHVRLALHADDEGLPWEALYDDRRQRLAASNAYVLVRDPDGRLPAPRARSGPLSLLAVAPGRTRLRVDAELAAIRQAFEHHGVAVQIAKPLFDRVTVDTLRERLAAKLRTDGAPYEILHFIGHGVVGTDGVPKLQLNDDGPGDHEIPPSSLASLLQGGAAMQASVGPQPDCAPRLVLLNACHSGSAAEARGLAGFGQELLSAGVRAVVAMQRAIRDDLAIDFAIAFYRELARSGRVDGAVTVGRQWLHQKQESDTATAFSTPVLFEVPDIEPVFEVSAAARVLAGPALAFAPAARGVSVPDTLVTAVLSKWCIPVLGPSLDMLSRDASRPAWTPGLLAETLARTCQFPELQVVTAMAQLGERLDHMLLQRVCEHFSAKQKGRPPLIKEIKGFLAGLREVPKIHDHLSSWPVPGFVCSHFDGFLTRAFEARGRAFRAIHSPDKPAPTSASDAPLIVNLRGSIADDSSLRLTGADHDRLLDAMMRMDAQSSGVAGLVTAYSGTCLLLLGATAWDPWLRHLLWRMVPRDSHENNTLYIVQRHPTDADKAAWGGFTVEWIDQTAEDVVAAITERVVEARR
jgi:hypothetical protein